MARTRTGTLLLSILIGIVAAVAYGLVHDQITIRICPEYFLVWHPKLTDSQDLTYVALLWGVVATWWMGAFLGLILGLAAVAGRKPPAPFNLVSRIVAWVILASAVSAAGAGVLAWISGFTAPPFLMGSTISELGAETRHRFSVDLAIHNASYTVSGGAGFAGAAWLLWYRFRRALP